MLQEVDVLYRGLVLGMVIAAPVGPVGLLCIRRTLQKGIVVGIATGFGSACVDAFFAAIAVLGLSTILELVHQYENPIQLVGGLIIFATAWHTWFDHPHTPEHPPEFVTKVMELPKGSTLKNSVRAALSGFIITLTNPITLFGTLAVVAAFGAVSRTVDATVLIGGIFAGSALWWFMLSIGVGVLLRKHFTEQRIITVNRITAVGLALLAFWALFSGISGYLSELS